MMRRATRGYLLSMIAGLSMGTASAVGTVTDSSPLPGVAYGVLVCAADGTELRVRLFDFSSATVIASLGEPCMPFIAQLKSSGFQVGPPVIGSVVPNATETLTWEVQGTH
nr:hypothetical protein [Gammaproteobacteria bacterium]